MSTKKLELGGGDFVLKVKLQHDKMSLYLYIFVYHVKLVYIYIYNVVTGGA